MVDQRFHRQPKIFAVFARQTRQAPHGGVVCARDRTVHPACTGRAMNVRPCLQCMPTHRAIQTAAHVTIVAEKSRNREITEHREIDPGICIDRSGNASATQQRNEKLCACIRLSPKVIQTSLLMYWLLYENGSSSTTMCKNSPTCISQERNRHRLH